MDIEIIPDGVWYHGSNLIFSELNEGSTVTQWKELAIAFSHKPKYLSYNNNGKILHTGVEKGYLYVIDEPISVGIDVYQHPKTTMDNGAEFITNRALKVKLVEEIEPRFTIYSKVKTKATKLYLRIKDKLK